MPADSGKRDLFGAIPKQPKPKLDARLREETIVILCQRKAKKDKVILPEKCWKHPEWKPFYVRQVTQYNLLAKIYPQTAIFEAVNKLSWAYSLSTKAIDQEIQNICKKVNQQLSTETIKPDTQIEHKERKSERSLWGDLND